MQLGLLCWGFLGRQTFGATASNLLQQLAISLQQQAIYSPQCYGITFAAMQAMTCTVFLSRNPTFLNADRWNLKPKRLFSACVCSNSDDNLLKNIELFDKLSLRFHGRIVFIKDVIGSQEICCWSYYGHGQKVAEVCCTSIVYGTDKKHTKVSLGVGLIITRKRGNCEALQLEASRSAAHRYAPSGKSFMPENSTWPCLHVCKNFNILALIVSKIRGAPKFTLGALHPWDAPSGNIFISEKCTWPI